MTNGDKIRKMSDEELVEVLFDGMGVSTSPPGRNCIGGCKWDSCRDCWLSYLGEEAEDEKSEFPPSCVSCTHGKQISPDGFDGLNCPHRGNIVQPWATCCDKYAPRGGSEA